MKFPQAYRNAIKKALIHGETYTVKRTDNGYSVVKGALDDSRPDCVFVASPEKLADAELPIAPTVAEIRSSLNNQPSRLSKLFTIG
jgi:phage portal protein BeeE